MNTYKHTEKNTKNLVKLNPAIGAFYTIRQEAEWLILQFMWPPWLSEVRE